MKYPQLTDEIRNAPLKGLIEYHRRVRLVTTTEVSNQLLELILDKTLENRVRAQVKRGVLHE